jgi:hypothetical protein
VFASTSSFSTRSASAAALDLIDHGSEWIWPLHHKINKRVICGRWPR